MPLAHFDAIRQEELSRVLASHRALFEGKDILELGSGTGTQLRAIQCVARSAVGLELRNGAYTRENSLNIVEYDGLRIPFQSASFDLVFSSNVMEHIPHQEQINREIKRVLRQGGKALHVVPTRTWRVLTTLLYYPAFARYLASRVGHKKVANGSAPIEVMRDTTPEMSFGQKLLNAMVPPKHGEFGGWLGDFAHFGLTSWQRRFSGYGWTVEDIEPIGLAYTGNCLLAGKVSMEARKVASRFLGSSAAIIVLS